MTGAELDALADKVADRLREPMISAALPAEVGELLRKMGQYGTYSHQDWIPWMAAGLRTDWRVSADGSLSLSLMDCNGQMLWQGTFRAVEHRTPNDRGGS